MQEKLNAADTRNMQQQQEVMALSAELSALKQLQQSTQNKLQQHDVLALELEAKTAKLHETEHAHEAALRSPKHETTDAEQRQQQLAQAKTAPLELLEQT